MLPAVPLQRVLKRKFGTYSVFYVNVEYARVISLGKFGGKTVFVSWGVRYFKGSV
jgi:hypothetical protein